MLAVDAFITALATLLTMFFILDWRLTLIAIVPMPFLSWGTGLIGRKNHESFKAAQEAFSDLNNKVQESVSGIRVTKSFGYQEAETQSFAKTNQEVYEKNVLAAKYDSLFDPLVLLFIGLSYVLTLIFGGIFISQGQFTIGEIGGAGWLRFPPRPSRSPGTQRPAARPVPNAPGPPSPGAGDQARRAGTPASKIGRASCRERV